MGICRCIDRTVHPFQLELLSHADADSFTHDRHNVASHLSSVITKRNVSVATEYGQCQAFQTKPKITKSFAITPVLMDTEINGLEKEPPPCCGMHYDWTQHQQLAQAVASTPTQDLGTGMALMGVALLMLANDLEKDLVRTSANTDAKV